MEKLTRYKRQFPETKNTVIRSSMAELAKTLFEESDKNRDRLIVVDSVFDLIEDEYKEYFKSIY